MLKQFGLVISIIFAISACGAFKENLSDFVIEAKIANNNPYTVFYQKTPNIKLTLTRSSKDDPNILLAVPGTYTSPQNKAEGFVIFNGKIIQDKERQGWDGAAVFKDGRVDILQTDKGKTLTRETMKSYAGQGLSLIQAHLLVMNGAAQSFKDQPLYQRRALAIFATGEQVIVESTLALELNQFAEDLVSLGVNKAVNLDMGAWSEGFYRDPSDQHIVSIGYSKSATDRQSNWIIFEK